MAKVDGKLFDAVKLLLENGATIQEAAKYMKVSPSTAKMIKSADDIEEYRNMIAALCVKQKAARASKKGNDEQQEPTPVSRPVEHKQTIIVQATWQMTQEMQKTNKLLESISAKLAFIVDELCGTSIMEAQG